MKSDLNKGINLFDTKTIIVVFNGEKDDHFYEQIDFEEIDVDEFEEE